jgi:hypothetical protein
MLKTVVVKMTTVKADITDDTAEEAVTTVIDLTKTLQ